MRCRSYFIGVVIVMVSAVFVSASIRDCFGSNYGVRELSMAQKRCLQGTLQYLPADKRLQLYKDLQALRKPSVLKLRDADLIALERNIRNKRTLNFVLQSLVGFGMNAALGTALQPPKMMAVTPAPNVTPQPAKNTPPTTPRMPPPPATVPPNQIDANTIRYPFRPAQTIPFLMFAPLPPGVTAPYPPLLQWPSRAPPPATTAAAPNSNKPCTCSTEGPPPQPPPTKPQFLEMPSVKPGGKPHLPISESTFNGVSSPSFNDDFPGGFSVDDANEDFMYHNYGSSFDHGASTRASIHNKPENYFDSGEYLPHGHEDDEEAEYLRNREVSNQKRALSHHENFEAFWPDETPYSHNPRLNNLAFEESYQPSTKKKKLRGRPAQFRIIIPPLSPRKRRDIFFDDAFKSFNLTDFDFHKLDADEQPESTQAQFLDVGNSKLIPSLGYRQKLEKDLEKYVELYVEKQISQGVIDVTKPKKTVVELKTKEGPAIKTVTTTVSKLIDGDKTLLESILDFSKSINPVVNAGELSGVNEEASPSATLHEGPLVSEESPVNRAFKDHAFGAFSWNNLFK